MDDDEPKKKKKGGAAAWMLTFADLVSLMLTFFVLLFSMSSVKQSQWEQLVQTLSRRLDPTRVESFTAQSAQYNIGAVFEDRVVDLSYLAAVLENKMEEDPLLSRSRLIRAEDWILISLPGDLVFPAGSAVASDRVRQALFVLGGVLSTMRNGVVIEGHAGVGDGANAWPLSLTRANVVANGLRDAGYGHPVTTLGLGDNESVRIPDEALPEDMRNASERRVDVLILATGQEQR